MTFDTRKVPVRHSHLKLMAQSPAHVYHAMRSGYSEQTLSTRLGSGTHGMIFQPHRVIVWEGKVRNGKVWEAFKADHADAIILNKREHTEARGIADALLRHKEANRLLLEGTTVEQTIDWEQAGRRCSGTPDAYTASWLVDLKTTRPMAPERFCRAAMWAGYPSQLAWYRDGLFRAGMADIGECYLVVVENAAPYVVTVIRVPERVLELGRKATRLWWERLMQCEAAGEWPGYAQETVDFMVPDEGELDLVFPDDEETNEQAQPESW